jgi:hypothetical protein
VTTPLARRLLAGVAALALTAGLVACGSDDQPAAITDDELVDPSTDHVGSDHPGGDHPGTSQPDGGGLGTGGLGGAASLEAACQGYVEVGQAMAGLVDGDPVEVLTDFAETAPLDVRAYAMVVAQGFAAAEDDPSAMAGEDFRTSLAQVGNFFFDHCELSEQIQVSAVDFAFTGLPSQVEAGVVGIELANVTASGEPHELVLLRRPDGDARSATELAHAPMEELMADHELVAVAWAETADDTMAVLVDLEPGSYLAICTIPTAGDPADPHAHRGMVATLEVA